MIYFSLPNFYENFYLNNFLYELSVTHPNYFRTPVIFNEMTGSFPYCSWGGHINNNYGTGAYYTDFVQCGQKTNMKLRFDFSNLLLIESDFHDAMANSIIQTNLGRNYSIEVVNIDLIKFLLEKYPTFDFNLIYSKFADYVQPFTPDLINDMSQLGVYKIIGLPERLNYDFQFLNQINDKTKIEITVNQKCPLSCIKRKECLLKEQELHLSYFKFSTYASCPLTFLENTNMPEILSLKDIEEKYAPLGFSNFTFSTFNPDTPVEVRVNFFINYFIKDEFHEEVFIKWHQRRVN